MSSGRRLLHPFHRSTCLFRTKTTELSTAACPDTSFPPAPSPAPPRPPPCPPPPPPLPKDRVRPTSCAVEFLPTPRRMRFSELSTLRTSSRIRVSRRARRLFETAFRLVALLDSATYLVCGIARTARREFRSSSSSSSSSTMLKNALRRKYTVNANQNSMKTAVIAQLRASLSSGVGAGCVSRAFCSQAFVS